jgi:predicted phosphodiesterase
MTLRWFRILVTALTFILFCTHAAAHPDAISKGPYIQAAGPTTTWVMWEAWTNASAAVHFGPKNRLTETVHLASPRQMKGVSTVSQTNLAGAKTNVASVRVTNVFYVYEAALANLKPGAVYAYSVEFAGKRTTLRQFKTLDPSSREVKFIAYGDSRSVPAIHAALVNRYRQHAPDFILHAGDLVADGKDYPRWSREFFTPAAQVIDHIPLFSVIGNHEEDGTNYLAYFHLPEQELWYSFDAGPVHVLALDYHFESANTEQFQFARADLLGSRAPWKIVFLHYPMFNIGGRASGWGHTNYLPLFRAGKIDLVLTGHSHLYERFRPARPSQDPGAWLITCITTGGGAANLHASFDHPALFARESTNHYVFFKATHNTLEARAIRVDGSIIDHFSLRKHAGKYPAAYVAQSYPEESLKLVSEITPLLSSRAAALPETDVPCDVTVSVTARQRPGTPATVSLTLAPESAAHYILENGPLSVPTPLKGATNTVSAVIRATGKSRITITRDRDLSPPLIFRASVQSREHQTIVYAAGARLSRPPAALANLGAGK